MILQKGASLDSVTKTGETILHGGVCGNNPEVVQFLLQSGKYDELFNLDVHCLKYITYRKL